MLRKLLPLCALGLIVLTGCPAPPRAPGPGAEQPPSGAPSRLGRPYDIVAPDSLLTIVVYRGGPLAKAGHNHVIASHDLRGTVYVPDDPAGATFELHVPVDSLSVDEPELRTREGAEFPPDVPESARDGTRHNMLGSALLDAEAHPEIVLESERLGSVQADHGVAHVRVDIRGQQHSIDVPLRFERAGTRLTVEGELALKQSDLGLMPFSAFLGALQVLDEMKIRFRLVARAAS